MKRPASLAAAVVATLACTIAAPALAASSATSASSESLTASSGSASTSLQGSSGSSTRTANVAAGDYRIVEVAAAPQRPGDVRLTLQRDAAAPRGDTTIYLTVPRTTLEGSRLAAGDRLAAAHRPYGLEFSAGTPREPFFLVLEDDWQRELKTVPVPG